MINFYIKLLSKLTLNCQTMSMAKLFSLGAMKNFTKIKQL